MAELPVEEILAMVVTSCAERGCTCTPEILIEYKDLVQYTTIGHQEGCATLTTEQEPVIVSLGSHHVPWKNRNN